MGLATYHEDFPLREWDRLLEHGEIALNLLRNSRANPKLSVCDTFGNFDFNRNLLVPPGTNIIMHVKSGKGASWAFHRETRWSVGLATLNYRYVTCYVAKTHRERITDTVELVPHNSPIPYATKYDHIKQLIEDLLHLLMYT